jgi:hypothetical protein
MCVTVTTAFSIDGEVFCGRHYNYWDEAHSGVFVSWQLLQPTFHFDRVGTWRKFSNFSTIPCCFQTFQIFRPTSAQWSILLSFINLSAFSSISFLADWFMLIIICNFVFPNTTLDMKNVVLFRDQVIASLSPFSLCRDFNKCDYFPVWRHAVSYLGQFYCILSVFISNCEAFAVVSKELNFRRLCLAPCLIPNWRATISVCSAPRSKHVRYGWPYQLLDCWFSCSSQLLTVLTPGCRDYFCEVVVVVGGLMKLIGCGTWALGFKMPVPGYVYVYLVR